MSEFEKIEKIFENNQIYQINK